MVFELDQVFSMVTFASEGVPGGHNTVRWILLGLDVFDFIVDLVFATRLRNTASTRPFGILLTVVTCVSACITAFKLYGRVESTYGWIIRFLVEDSTTIIIMFNVEGAYDPNFFIDILNLVMSITYGILTFMGGILVVCLMCNDERASVGGSSERPRFDDDDRGCWLNCSICCAFVSVGGMVTLGILIVDSGGEIAASGGAFGPWLQWTFYAVVLLLGTIIGCAAVIGGLLDPSERVCHLECCCIDVPRKYEDDEPQKELVDEGKNKLDAEVDQEDEDSVAIENKLEQAVGLEDDGESVDDVEEASEYDQELLMKLEESAPVENGNSVIFLEEESEMEVEC